MLLIDRDFQPRTVETLPGPTLELSPAQVLGAYVLMDEIAGPDNPITKFLDFDRSLGSSEKTVLEGEEARQIDMWAKRAAVNDVTRPRQPELQYELSHDMIELGKALVDGNDKRVIKLSNSILGIDTPEAPTLFGRIKAKASKALQ